MPPRAYLSYTQLTLWEQNPESWADVYLEHRKRGTSRAQAKGSQLADALEHDKTTGDPVMDLVISKLPRLDVKETEVRCLLHFPEIDVPLLAKPDTHASNLRTLFEYKSGQLPWTQKKVDEFDQLTFYDVVFVHARREAMKKQLQDNYMEPTDLALFWAPTEFQDDGELHFTGEVHRFPTKRDWIQRAKMSLRCKKAWLGITKLCAEKMV